MARLTTTDFRPAVPWSWLIAVAAPLNRALITRHTRVDIELGSLQRLRHLPAGVLIAPNHSHYYDAQVTFDLARRAGRRVVFMATRELFDAWGGLGGLLYQRLGVFSVNRGGENRDARTFARSVLASGTRDLLMFPEGEVYLLNDLVMPLKPGIARFALETASLLDSEGRQRPVLIVPVAIKYRYTEDITEALQALATRLEQAVLGKPQTGALYPRIVALGTALLTRQEAARGVTPRPGHSLFERVARLRHIVLERLEHKHFGQAQAGPDFNRARKLMIRIQGSMLVTAGGDGCYGPPPVRSTDRLAPDLEDARLCARSVAFHEDYLTRHASLERMAETFVKLEREVLGTETRTFGRRRAVVRVGRPIDVSTYLPQYRASSEDAIEEVVIRVHDALQHDLDVLSSPALDRPSRGGHGCEDDSPIAL